MLQQIVEEFKGEERIIKDETINACVEHVRMTMTDGKAAAAYSQYYCYGYWS